jgi:Cu/Ag efflux protein CusF
MIMKNLKFAATTISLLTIALALTGCWTPPNANVQPVGKLGLIQGDISVQVIQEPVTVIAIDAAHRTITLKHANDSTKIFTVGDTVKNLDDVKVGDTIKAEVKAELSVYILEGGRLPNADGTTRPKTINFNAKVLQVDPSYRLLTLQFSNGQTMTIKAGLNVMLEKMAPGDDVVMRSNEITGITIKKP